MKKSTVKLKLNSTNTTIFTLNGGSESGDFVNVAYITDQDRDCCVQADDSIVSINDVNVIGYSLADAKSLLDELRCQSNTCPIKVFAKNKYNKDLRSFLYSTHLPESSEEEAKIAGFINLFCYKKILCTDETLCAEKKDLYEHATMEKISELQETESLLYVCQDDNILFALQTPDTHSTMDQDLYKFIRANEHCIAEISSLTNCNTQDSQLIAQYNTLRVVHNYLSFVEENDSIPAGKKERVLLTTHKVNVLPIKQHFGFDLSDISHNVMIRSFVDPESEFKGCIEIAKIYNNWPNKVIYRLQKKDVLYSVDVLNAKDNTSEEMLLCALKRMTEGKITQFVFIRIQFYIIRNVREIQTPAFPLADVSIYEHNKDKDSFAGGDYICRKRPLPLSYKLKRKNVLKKKKIFKRFRQNKHKQSLGKFGRIYPVENVKFKPHWCQIFFKPGDIIWNVNSVELANIDPEFVKRYIKSCKDQNDWVDMVIWREIKAPQGQNSTIAAIKSNRQYTQQNKPKQISQLLNIRSQLKNQLELSKAKLPVKTTLRKKAINQYGLVILQNKQKQYVVDSQVVDSFAQSSKKLNLGDVIVSVNKVPIRDLSIKTLQHLIVSSQKYLELEFFKRGSDAEQEPLTNFD